MLAIQVNTPTQDKVVITTLGTISLSETITRSDRNCYSVPTLTVQSTVLSGVATHLQLELFLAETYAENLVSFTDIPTAGDTVTLSGITYTFIPLASGYTADYQVKLGSTAFGTALNFFKVVNASGINGTDYYTAQPAHPTMHALYVDNPLVIRALTSGTDGNSLTATTTSDSIILAFDTLYNGGITYDNSTLLQKLTWTGTGTYQFDPVVFHPTGTSYEGTATIWADDAQTVNASGVAVEYTLSPTKFYGKTTVDEFVEVTGLSGIWADNGYADSSGIFYITWDSPSLTYSGVTAPVSAPGTTGTPTQTTRSISTIDSVQPIEYNIFVYTGSTAPERQWPRPVDANGTWYWAGRTSKTYAQVNVPSNTLGIWVGYGNKYTYASSVTNLNQTLPTIYIS